MADWATSWNLMLQDTKRNQACSIDFWDTQASGYDQNNAGLADLTAKQMSRIHLEPTYTVLDVGAGTGRLTLPMAKKVKQVTAVDPSQNMLKVLSEKAQKENLTNIQQINKPWEKLTVNRDIAPYDVVVASLSFFMTDLGWELGKMDAAAKKAVYLFVSASKWMDDDIRKIANPKTPSPYPDHMYLFNILNSVSILANVELMDVELRQKFGSLDQAVLKFTKQYSIPQTNETQLRKYLAGILREVDGQFWLNRTRKIAMIWWTKNQ
jgi:SAM-dependent methyltransferase